MMRCTRCKGTNVQLVAWVNPNTGKRIDDYRALSDVDTKWCDDCCVHTLLEKFQVEPECHLIAVPNPQRDEEATGGQMNRKQNLRARNIARLDKKTSDERLIKLVEEVGELARALLILKDVHGTQYREPVAKEDIAEEIADVILCANSLAEKMGLAGTPLARMLDAKMDKWEWSLGGDMMPVLEPTLADLKKMRDDEVPLRDHPRLGYCWEQTDHQYCGEIMYRTHSGAVCDRGHQGEYKDEDPHQ